MTDYRQKLKECRSCAEAKPIMEALHMGPSSQQLMDYYYQLRVSKDPRQQAHGENAFQTAFREMEDEHKNNNNHLKEDDGGAHRKQGGEEDIDKIVSEADEITGELDSHQSSKLDMPYPQEGTDAPQSDIESSKTASGENQMGGIKENLPGMLPMGQPMQQGIPQGMPPAPGMPPMAPDVQQQMAPQMPKIPPMNTGQQMRQMQYTVDANNKQLYSRVINPLIREVKKLREANIALDKKIQETQGNAGSMKLDLDRIKENSPVRDHRIQETIPGTNIEVPQTRFPKAELEETRYKMAQLDKELAKAKPTPYQ